ncbi:hypothetical protein AMAG_17267 [Allomyces macrogynus ATCC 38327]|uniref:C2H2-type domain-containing protein n=1 Tax=Allomyces macrogynus (strain ATCC 38327) TaxID=578462 RepID=A0A0L0TEV9_ALLM3|nr:hypothetical protein AMAG_17267 [Allomyces macrogynus ATCC 38327]|eukprot:KNE73119.1 hypothetical protein AMAG_17267 [Allomyces macrogynus ATCC 38327]
MPRPPGIPCTVASCTDVAPTPPEFHRHLVSHLPADRQQQYLTPDDQGVFRGLPTDLMPAPPRPVLRNTFVRYMTHHWPGLAAKYPDMQNVEIRSRLAHQWAELDEGIKARYAAICDDIRKRFKRVAALFSLQCEALGVPHFTTPRQIEVPTDWSSVDRMTTPDGALRTAVDEGEEVMTEPQSDASPADSSCADAPAANPPRSNPPPPPPPPPVAELVAEDVGTPMDIDAIGDESARDAAQSILKRQWSFGVPESKRRKKDVDAPPTVTWTLKPLTADEWQKSGRPRIPCTVVQCDHLSPTPLEFFQHLVAHLPADEHERYAMADPDGTYPCLPLDVMPAPPRTRHHGTPSLYKALHWAGVKAKQPNATRTQLGELLTQQWHKLDPHLQAEYTAVDAQIRMQRSRLNAVFMLQCEALGVPDYTTTRQAEVPVDWSAIAARMNPDGTPRSGNLGETVAAVLPPPPPPPPPSQPKPVKRWPKKSVPAAPLSETPSSAAPVLVSPQPVVLPPSKPKNQNSACSSGAAAPSDVVAPSAWSAAPSAWSAAPSAQSAVPSSGATNLPLSTSRPVSSSATLATASSMAPTVASSTSTPSTALSRATPTTSPELPSLYPSTWSPSVAAAMAVLNGPPAPFIRPQVIPSPSFRMLVNNRVAQALSPAPPVMHAAAGPGAHPSRSASASSGPAPPTTTALPGVAPPLSLSPSVLPTTFAAYQQARQIGDQITPNENQSALQSYFNLMNKDSEFKEFREQQAQARAQREAGIVRVHHDMRIRQARESAALADGPQATVAVSPLLPETRNSTQGAADTSSGPAATALPDAPARSGMLPEEQQG